MRILYLLLFAFLSLFLIAPLHATIIHVPGDSSTIQGGINGTVDGDTVLVADGIYTGDGNRDIDFLGKAIAVMSENGPENCIIDCGGAERGFHFHSGEDLSSVVEGFTITNGNSSVGGGMANRKGSSPKVTNCVFIGNSAYANGGGMYNSDGSNPLVANCLFIGNSTNINGGGMYNRDGSSPTVTNCSFIGNSTVMYGGGIYNEVSNPSFTNCAFSENSAGGWGGGMYNHYYSVPTMTNCTFSENSAGVLGSGMYNNYYSDPMVTNSIFWGDLSDEIYNNSSSPIVTYSDVQGGYPGVGNIDADPLFVTFHGTELLLRRGSACIDAGDPSIEDGINWPGWYQNGSRSDMGAYGGPGNEGWLR